MSPDNSPATETPVKYPDAAFAKPLAAMELLAQTLRDQFSLNAENGFRDKKGDERFFRNSTVRPVNGWENDIGTVSGSGADTVYHSRLRVSFEDAAINRAGTDKIWNNYHLISGTPSWEVLHKGAEFWDHYSAHYMKRDAVLWVDVTTKADGQTTFAIEPERSDEMPGRLGVNWPGKIFGTHTFWSYYGLKPNAKNGFSHTAYTSDDGTLPPELVSDFKAFYRNGVRKNIFKVM